MVRGAQHAPGFSFPAGPGLGPVPRAPFAAGHRPPRRGRGRSVSTWRGEVLLPDFRSSPVLLSLASAVMFGLSTTLVKKGLQTIDSRLGAFISITSTTAYLWLLEPKLMESAFWASPGIWWFAAVGLFRPVLSVNLSYAGNRLLGPTITASVNATQPLFSALFAVLYLREALSLPVLAGTLAITGGIIVFSWSSRGTLRNWSRWALLFPFGAALVRSFGNVGNKAGLNLLPSAYASALVSYTVSWSMALAEFLLVSRRMKRPAVSPVGVLWFCYAGVVAGVATLTLNAALALGQVVIVIPINATSPLFTLLFSFLVFRVEAFSLRVLVGVLLVVPGVVLIGLYR